MILSFVCQDVEILQARAFKVYTEGLAYMSLSEFEGNVVEMRYPNGCSRVFRDSGEIRQQAQLTNAQAEGNLGSRNHKLARSSVQIRLGHLIW
jgi:hypothetical protein